MRAVAKRSQQTKRNVKTYAYNSYRFIDKDPVIDLMRTAIAESKTSYAQIERSSGVTGQTLRNWFQGSTKRPQFATVKAVARAIGKDIALVDRATHH